MPIEPSLALRMNVWVKGCSVALTGSAGRSKQVAS